MEDMPFFVYAVMDGDVPIYIGKGTKNRHKVSAKKHCGRAVILERFSCEDSAFAAEARWIEEMSPANNKCRGGNGGRVSNIVLPSYLKGKLTLAEWRCAVRDGIKSDREIDAIGSRRYCAKFLVRKLNEANCAEYGVSTVDLCRLKELANG